MKKIKLFSFRWWTTRWASCSASKQEMKRSHMVIAYELALGLHLGHLLWSKQLSEAQISSFKSGMIAQVCQSAFTCTVNRDVGKIFEPSGDMNYSAVCESCRKCRRCARKGLLSGAFMRQVSSYLCIFWTLAMFLINSGIWLWRSCCGLQ